MSAPPRPFADGDRDRAGRSAAYHLHLDRAPHAVSFEHGLYVVGIGHGSTAERDQHVANQYARQRRRSLRFERKNDQTFLMIGQLDGLQTDRKSTRLNSSHLGIS